jgi:hypothetical protein
VGQAGLAYALKKRVCSSMYQTLGEKGWAKHPCSSPKKAGSLVHVSNPRRKRVGQADLAYALKKRVRSSMYRTLGEKVD